MRMTHKNRSKAVHGFLFLLGLWASYGFTEISLSDVETALLEKDYPKAQESAREFIKTYPLNPRTEEAFYYLGLSQLYLENFEDARQTFSQVLHYTSDQNLNDKASMGVIDSYLLQGDYKTALNKAQQLEKLSPESELMSLIYLKIARANLKLANWQKARAYLAKIAKEFPRSLESRLAKQLLEEKQYFAVQLGAFIDRNRAEQLMMELKDKGEYVYIVETTDHRGNQFYRVRIGQLSSLKQAQKLRSKMSQQGYPTQIFP